MKHFLPSSVPNIAQDNLKEDTRYYYRVTSRGNDICTVFVRVVCLFAFCGFLLVFCGGFVVVFFKLFFI